MIGRTRMKFNVLTNSLGPKEDNTEMLESDVRIAILYDKHVTKKKHFSDTRLKTVEISLVYLEKIYEIHLILEVVTTKWGLRLETVTKLETVTTKWSVRLETVTKLQ